MINNIDSKNIKRMNLYIETDIFFNSKLTYEMLIMKSDNIPIELNNDMCFLLDTLLKSQNYNIYLIFRGIYKDRYKDVLINKKIHLLNNFINRVSPNNIIFTLYSCLINKNDFYFYYDINEKYNIEYNNKIIKQIDRSKNVNDILEELIRSSDDIKKKLYNQSNPNNIENKDLEVKKVETTIVADEEAELESDEETKIIEDEGESISDNEVDIVEELDSNSDEEIESTEDEIKSVVKDGVDVTVETVSSINNADFKMEEYITPMEHNTISNDVFISVGIENKKLEEETEIELVKKSASDDIALQKDDMVVSSSSPSSDERISSNTYEKNNVLNNSDVDITNQIFMLIKENPKITQRNIHKEFNISLQRVNNSFKFLLENNKIKRVGENKNGYWETFD